MNQHDKHFTLQEARALLPEVINKMAEIKKLKDHLDEKGYDIYRHQYFGGMGPNGQRFFPPEMERLVNLAKEIDDRGILIKSIDQGLIDFPHIRANGEEVYLCWMFGEDDILYWHSIPDGFAGRRLIEEL
jgi:hypothetical protein